MRVLTDHWWSWSHPFCPPALSCGEVGKILKTLDKDKKLFDGLLKDAEGDKEIESLMKSMQKLMGDKKKLLQDVEKAVKKKK